MALIEVRQEGVLTNSVKYRRPNSTVDSTRSAKEQSNVGSTGTMKPDLSVNFSKKPKKHVGGKEDKTTYLRMMAANLHKGERGRS